MANRVLLAVLVTGLLVAAVGCETVYTNQKLTVTVSEQSGNKVHAIVALDDIVRLGPTVIANKDSRTITLHDPGDAKNQLKTGGYKIEYWLIPDPSSPGTAQLIVKADDLVKGDAKNTIGAAPGEVVEGSYSFELKAPK